MKRKSSDNRNKQDDGECNEAVTFKDNIDICQQLMDRYTKSSAPQHSHLLATAATMRSILKAESLPLTPPAYFAAAISAADSAMTSSEMDSTAVSALLTFLSIVIPMIPPGGIDTRKASEAMALLVDLLERDDELGVPSLRGGVKCLGALLVGYSDLQDWGSFKLGFESLVKFSIDKRPKIRRCSQECLEKVLKLVQTSTVIEEASKSVYSLFTKHMSMAVSVTDISTKNVDDVSQHLHLLNLLKLSIPFLSSQVASRILIQLCKLMTSHFSPLTRQILQVMEVYFQTSTDQTIIPGTDQIVDCLMEYLSFGKNPVDTIISAAALLGRAFETFKSRSCLDKIPVICESLAGLLNPDNDNASRASLILKDLINRHMDPKGLLIHVNPSFEDNTKDSGDANAIKSTCAIFENRLDSSDAISNDHVLALISHLFHKLGEYSYIFLRSITLKLGELMTLANGDSSDATHLRNCIGSAVIAMGPERILKLLPISLHADDLSCSNIWLVPILKNHTVGASLGYYVDHIVPLAKSFYRAGRGAKNSENGKELQAHARDLLLLLPAFCRYPTDTSQKFGSLAELLIKFLHGYSFMRDSISVALQVLVNQNKSIINPQKLADDSNDCKEDSMPELGSITLYSKKVATKNIRALASCSTELLQALIDIFVGSRPGTCLYLKDAIGCVASITSSSITKRIFISLHQKLKLSDGEGEAENQGSRSDESIDKEKEKKITSNTKLKRFVVMDLASSLVEGADEDLVDLIYTFIQQTLQSAEEIGQREAYHTLSRVLEEHSWFCSSHFVELIDLLLSIESPIKIESLRCRFACLHILMVHAFKMSTDEENEKAFLILNEIILQLKDGKEEHRKVAYDALLLISTNLRSLSSSGTNAPFEKMISMITGYLSGSSPQIKSGAVYALSGLVYKDPDICLSMPDLVTSILSLLQNKAIEVVKAVLGFAKVLVSSLQSEDLRNHLSDIVGGILPWSSVSRHHFREKVTVILEIVIRKCGPRAVELVSPEKYKGFIKIILRNRNAKTSSKQSSPPETGLPDSASPGGQPKRKHGEEEREKTNTSSFSGSSKPPVSTKGTKPWKKPRHFESNNPENGRSSVRKGQGNKELSKGGSKDGKRNMDKSSKRKRVNT